MDDTQKQPDPLKAPHLLQDDNPKDDDVVQEKTDPNATLSAEEIIQANNFLGDLS